MSSPVCMLGALCHSSSQGRMEGMPEMPLRRHTGLGCNRCIVPGQMLADSFPLCTPCIPSPLLGLRRSLPDMGNMLIGLVRLHTALVGTWCSWQPQRHHEPRPCGHPHRPLRSAIQPGTGGTQLARSMGRASQEGTGYSARYGLSWCSTPCHTAEELACLHGEPRIPVVPRGSAERALQGCLCVPSRRACRPVAQSGPARCLQGRPQAPRGHE